MDQQRYVNAAPDRLVDKPIATVLVVDDTPDNLTLMAGLLQGLYRVKVAASGEKALVIAQSDAPPDLLLLDIMMPGTLNGLEVCRQIKADHATRFTKVVLLTARVQAGDKEAGLAAGADDYLMKPFSTLQVLETIYRMEAEA